MGAPIWKLNHELGFEFGRSEQTPWIDDENLEVSRAGDADSIIALPFLFAMKAARRRR